MGVSLGAVQHVKRGGQQWRDLLGSHGHTAVLDLRSSRASRAPASHHCPLLVDIATPRQAACPAKDYFLQHGVDLSTFPCLVVPLDSW